MAQKRVSISAPFLKHEYTSEEFKRLVLNHGVNGELPEKNSVPKFRNKRTEITCPLTGDTLKFQSLKEAQYYISLTYRMRPEIEESLRITKIDRQKAFELVVNGIRVGLYRADFEITYVSGRVEVIDVKGYLNPKSLHTQLFELKIALVRALYGVEVIKV